MMNNAKDYLQTMRNCTFITSGSFGEGLVMRGSDLDVMYVCKFAEVCEDKNMCFKPNITYFVMEAEDSQPCFVRLRLRYFTGRFFFASFLEEIGGSYYLSNARLKEQMTDLRCPNIHCPCLSDTHDTMDIALCFRNQIPNGHELTSRIYKEQSCSHIDIRKLLFSPIAYVAYHAQMKTFDYEKAIHVILSFESSKIKYLYLHFMSKFCCISDQFLPFKFISDNKSTYNEYSSRLSSLLQNTHHDAVSGWLMLASFFYGTKQYYIALGILQYSLSKCSSEKLYHGMDVSYTQHKLLNMKLLKNMSFAQLCKFMLVNVLDLISLRPREIPDEGEGIYNIPPVVYSHFLRFLCHYHLKNTSKYLDSINDLQTTIEEHYFTGNSYETYVSYNTLGLTFELSGDKKSAKRAYKQALKFKPRNRVGW
ncbi:unnamed protein product [Mytilus coruscus]|uniref:Uncharacterized protein n=1 Tax=Mytilus coruscus TaxID=42192 RepID=A0A6J8F0C7_MYTCO|nr:unnamed protein product [Mytilus coruscus]